jgi:hypothetical protein
MNEYIHVVLIGDFDVPSFDWKQGLHLEISSFILNVREMLFKAPVVLTSPNTLTLTTAVISLALSFRI